MSKSAPVIIVVLALLLVVVVGAGLIGLALFWFQSPGNQTVGTVLVYEVDSKDSNSRGTVDINRLIKAIDQRINPSWPGAALVSAQENGQIKIEVFGTEPENAQHVERLLARAGTLEFRILANARDHPALLQQAKAAGTTELKDAAGQVIAWWIPVAESEMTRNAFGSPEILTRPSEQGDETSREVLVVKDPFDVTGQYLASASVTADSRGNPAVAFSLNTQGGKRFGGLTGSNLPDPASGFTRQLAIILDGTVHSAPSIRSTIFDRGIIEGRFTQQEVQDLVAVLNAGSLPAPVRLVDKRIVKQPE